MYSIFGFAACGLFGLWLLYGLMRLIVKIQGNKKLIEEMKRPAGLTNAESTFHRKK